METGRLQPPLQIIHCFLSLALQQKFEKEIYFYIQFLLKSFCYCLN